MAYFPNGTSGHDYESKYCDRCTHNPEDLSDVCPIWDLHWEYNYDQHKKTKLGKAIKDVLEMLIPSDEKGFPKECSMFVPRTDPQQDYVKHLQEGEPPIDYILKIGA